MVNTPIDTRKVYSPPGSPERSSPYQLMAVRVAEMIRPVRARRALGQRSRGPRSSRLNRAFRPSRTTVAGAAARAGARQAVIKSDTPIIGWPTDHSGSFVGRTSIVGTRSVGLRHGPLVVANALDLTDPGVRSSDAARFGRAPALPPLSLDSWTPAVIPTAASPCTPVRRCSCRAGPAKVLANGGGATAKRALLADWAAATGHSVCGCRARSSSSSRRSDPAKRRPRARTAATSTARARRSGGRTRGDRHVLDLLPVVGR